MTAILLVLQVCLLLTVRRLMLRSDVSPVLSTSLLIFALMWYAIPVVITILFWNDLSSHVEFNAFVSTATVETVVLLCTTVGLILAPWQIYSRAIANNFLVRFNPGIIVTVVTIGAGIALDFYVEYSYGEVLGHTYLARNAFSVNAAATPEYGVIGSINFLQLMFISFGYACLFTKWPSNFQNRLIGALLAFWVAINIVRALAMGSRIVVLLPLILLLLAGRVRNWPVPKLVRRVGVLGVLTFVGGGILIIVIGQFRSKSIASGQEIVSSAADYLDGSRSPSDVARTFLLQVAIKLDSFSVGAFLLERMGTNYAGWQPYIGAALSVVPRRLLESKPVPGSVDGTYSGHPSRLMAAAMGMDSASGNVNVSAASVAIWQLGYFNLPIMVACNVLYLIFLNSLLLSPSIILKTLAVFAIGIPTFLTLFGSPDVVILNAERLLVLYALLQTGKFLKYSHSRGRIRGSETVPGKSLCEIGRSNRAHLCNYR